jgi:recombination protein RecA
MGDAQVGLHARMMSKAMRKLTTVVSRSRCTLMFINQVRQKIGVTFGPTEVTTGGNALKYYASVRLDVRRVKTLTRAELAVGARTRVKVVKNKLAPPFRQVEFDIVFGRGVHRVAEVVDLAEAQGVLTRNGSWYALGDSRLANGRDALVALLEADAALRGRVTALLRAERMVPVAEA